MRYLTRFGTGCAVAAACLLTAAAAEARPEARGALRPAAGHLVPAATATPPGSTFSEDFGGYAVAPPEGISSVSSTFRIPKSVSCPQPQEIQRLYVGEWIDNTTGNRYVTGGATDAAASAEIECLHGSPQYGILASTQNGTDSGALTAPGDLIETRVEEMPSGEAVASVVDLTSGASVSSSAASNGEGDVVDEGAVPDQTFQGVDGQVLIPKLSSISVTGSQAGGLFLSEVSPDPTVLNQDGYNQIVPGRIAPLTGAFTLTEKHQ